MHFDLSRRQLTASQQSRHCMYVYIYILRSDWIIPVMTKFFYNSILIYSNIEGRKIEILFRLLHAHRQIRTNSKSNVYTILNNIVFFFFFWKLYTYIREKPLAFVVPYSSIDR